METSSNQETNSSSTVIIVDDELQARETLKMLIESQGMKCITMGSAEQYLKSPPFKRPACLVLDYQLPGISGLELQKKLLERDDRIPIIIISGHINIASTVEFMEAEAVTLLEKPFPPKKLLDAISRALQLDIKQKELHDRYQRLKNIVVQLSERERIILNSVIEGNINKKVAKDLSVSLRTIESDRSRIVEAFGVKTMNQVVAEFSQLDLLCQICSAKTDTQSLKFN